MYHQTKCNETRLLGTDPPVETIRGFPHPEVTFVQSLPEKTDEPYFDSVRLLHSQEDFETFR